MLLERKISMLYNSTQNAAEVVSSAQAIAQGISKDGGLFVPQEFPKYDENTFNALLKTDYKGRAKKVFSDFLTDFTDEEIADCVEKAYTAEKFGSENPAPLAFCNVDGKTLNILELWHGPTCAFKDMALQILPHLLTKSLKKTYDGKVAVILVATSGDTGKAALEGFKDVDNTKIIVFYPVDGVSPMQKHQMNTQVQSKVTLTTHRPVLRKYLRLLMFQINLQKTICFSPLLTQSTGADFFLRLFIISQHIAIW